MFMGSTHTQFILFQGPAGEDVAKLNLLKYITYSMKQLEKDIVTFSPENFTIGKHVFNYASLQSLELADLRVLYSRGTLTTKYIRIVEKDGEEFILIPSMVGGDTVRSMSLRAEDLIKSLNEASGKSMQGSSVQKQVEAGAIEKLKKMLSVSTRIKMDMMRALGLDENTFSNKIFDWAAEFKFKIDGDMVVIEGGNVEGFLSKLDAEFVEWEKGIKEKK
jgi:hypothetical protein